MFMETPVASKKDNREFGKELNNITITQVDLC